MIDIGISKIVLISAVALVVLGPDRLPRVARPAGNLFGRAQRYMAEVKSEVNRQMEQEDIRKMKEAATEAFNSAKGEFKDLDKAIASQVAEVNNSMNAAVSDLNSTGSNHEYDSGGSNSIYSGSDFSDSEFKSSVRQGRSTWRNKKGAIPVWFKKSSGIKTRAQSGAARVKRFRRAASQITSQKSFFG